MKAVNEVTRASRDRGDAVIFNSDPVTWREIWQAKRYSNTVDVAASARTCGRHRAERRREPGYPL